MKLREDFKIFSRRKLTQLKELCLDRHNLFVIVFGTFAGVEKIFWFGHTILDSKATKLLRTHLAQRPPSVFVSASMARGGFCSVGAATPRPASVLSSEEVAMCDEILTFARTHFTSQSV
ncbi:hypothetical protein K2Q16_02145 [Patescibacteria group bacterium]|nr:hypothetical protein [Patescibacteria group bacterium]